MNEGENNHFMSCCKYTNIYKADDLCNIRSRGNSVALSYCLKAEGEKCN